MQFTKLILQNWMNFRHVDVPLRERMFVVGPNASGKSNLLAAFRFLRDVAEARGGLQYAVEKFGGMSSIRSLHARRRPEVVLEVEMSLDDVSWRYRLVLAQNNQRQVIVKEEKVWRDGGCIRTRPDDGDASDPGRLAQTHLEQVPCAPALIARLLPRPSPLMRLQIAVHAVEAWLIGDPESLSAFLGVRRGGIPPRPEVVVDPKRALIDLARQSRRRTVRDEIAPPAGSKARVGPGYAAALIEYATGDWRPSVAAAHCESLASLRRYLSRVPKLERTSQ